MSKQGLGAGSATERIAAELSLRRLIREKNVFINELGELEYQLLEPYELALSDWEDKFNEFESAKAEKLNKILLKQMDQAPDFHAFRFFFAALLVSAIWLFSDWTWLWIVVFGLIFGSVVAWAVHLSYKAGYKRVEASKPPEPPPPIFPVKSQIQKDVEDRIAEIDSEIAQHLAFLESTKPTGTSKEPEDTMPWFSPS